MAPKDKAPAKGKAPGDEPPECCPPFLFYSILLVISIGIIVSGVLIAKEISRVAEETEPNKEALKKLRTDVAEWALNKKLGESTLKAVEHLTNIEELEEGKLEEYEKARMVYAKTFKTKPKFRLWNIHGNSNYYISKTKKNWYDAEKFCRDRDSHLASIISYEEQDFITSQLMEPAWIGLSKNTLGAWEWVDNSGFTAQYWSEEKSKSEHKGGMKQDCATIAPSFNSYNWKEANCYKLNRWVCKINLEEDNS